jgi:hypothetical protein
MPAVATGAAAVIIMLLLQRRLLLKLCCECCRCSLVRAPLRQRVAQPLNAVKQAHLSCSGVSAR